MTAKGREKVFMDKCSSSYRTKITGEFSIDTLLKLRSKRSMKSSRCCF